MNPDQLNKTTRVVNYQKPGTQKVCVAMVVMYGITNVALNFAPMITIYYNTTMYS